MFKKGQSGNPKGKEPGTKNARTEQWEALGQALVSKHAGRANEIMEDCDDETFMDNFHKLLEYFKPKQQKVTATVDGEMAITFTRRDAGNRNTPK